MLTTILFVLVRCASKPEISSIEIQETDDRSLQGIGETIRINNCGGEAKIEQNIQQLHEIRVSGLSPELNTQVLREAVAAHYAKDYGTSRDISLIIPPNTHKEIVIAWMYETRSGVLIVKGKSEQPTFTIKIAFGVGPVASTDLGC
ncbi:MAG: hypothetical protein L0287_35830 [Anaerolineae bacterium]|nr:hypothetical protein [Anaerolineae bacterium]MCI0610552.1 hypothetical protein [Anaerolineae bacterium]